MLDNKFILSFNRDVILKTDNEKLLLLRGEYSLPIKNSSIGIRTLLALLADNGANVDELWEKTSAVDPTIELTHFYFFIERLSQNGFIKYILQQDKKVLATLEPMAPGFQFEAILNTAETHWRLSRFAYMHAVDSKFFLESPLSAVRLWLNDSHATALVTSLITPRSQNGLQNDFPQLTSDTQSALLQMLLTTCAIFAVDSDGKLPEECELTLRQWEFHDLLFHSRNCSGRHDYLYGGTFRFLNNIEATPVTKAPMSTEIIQLPIPDPKTFQHGPLFQDVLETRRSIRTASKKPLVLIQLSEFLYRSAHIKSLHPANKTNKKSYETSSRPYPSGGAMYELEIYLNVQRCEGLRPGLYHYNPQNHSLEYLVIDDKAVELYFQTMVSMSGTNYNPDILITITARFSRVSWKYQSIAYALILKNVGVLYQTFYLVATAMKLAPCAIGGGNADAFANLTGLDYYTESSVGQFMLSNISDQNVSF